MFLLKPGLYSRLAPLTARAPPQTDEAFILDAFAVEIFFEMTGGAQTKSSFKFTFTFMHLADAFIQSDLHCIQVTVYQLLLSLGIEPMILALLAPCSTI